MSTLYNLLQETILTEGRKEQVMAKFPEVDVEVIEFLSKNDPSGNNKYLEWAVKQVNEGVDGTYLLPIIQKYHRNLSLINDDSIKEYLKNYSTSIADKLKKSAKDINIFPTASELRDFVNFLEEKGAKSRLENEIKAEGDRIFENKDLLVVSPRTHRASCKYGVHSKWCVSTSNTDYYQRYTKDGTLYFFISKKNHPYTKYWNDRDDHNEPPYKTALLLKDSGEASWWSKADHNYTDGLDTNDPKLSPFFSERIKNAVLAHNKDAIQNRLKRQIEETLKAKSFYKPGSSDNLKQNLGGFVQNGIFTQEQLMTIIRNDNWLVLYENSNTGKLIRKQLGSENVFTLVKELLSDENVKDVLRSMDTQEFFRAAINGLSDEQNRELARLMVEKLGSKPTAKEIGNDVKIFVDKWTLSPEGWEKYKNSSDYFIVGDIVDGVIKPLEMIKVDRFDPTSHHQLNVSSYTAKSTNNKLYGITTERGLLDDFIGSRPDLPGPIRQLISSKARQLWPKASKV